MQKKVNLGWYLIDLNDFSLFENVKFEKVSMSDPATCSYFDDVAHSGNK